MLEVINNSIIVVYLLLYVYCIINWWRMDEDFIKLMDNILWGLPIVGILISLILYKYDFAFIWTIIFIIPKIISLKLFYCLDSVFTHSFNIKGEPLQLSY